MKTLNADKIRELVEARGWPQNELARRAGISKTTLSEILRHKNPTLRNLTQIAETLGVDIDELLEAEQPEDETGQLALAM